MDKSALHEVLQTVSDIQTTNVRIIACGGYSISHHNLSSYLVSGTDSIEFGMEVIRDAVMALTIVLYDILITFDR